MAENQVLAKNTINVDGETIEIFVQVDKPTVRGGLGENERSDAVDKTIDAAKDMLADAMKLVKTSALRAYQSINSINETSRPDEWEVKMAVKLDSKVGAFIAELNAGAQLEVTMKWKVKS